MSDESEEIFIIGRGDDMAALNADDEKLRRERELLLTRFDPSEFGRQPGGFTGPGEDFSVRDDIAADSLPRSADEHCRPGRCLGLTCCSYECSQGRCPSLPASSGETKR